MYPRVVTSLDTVESTVEPPATVPPYRVYRHSRHSERRKLILHLLTVDSETSPSRRQRYHDCGRGGFVWWDPDEHVVRLTCYRCRDLFCPTCARERRRHVRERLMSFFADMPCEHTLKLLTLTTRSTDDPLSDQLDHLIGSFRRLRQRRWWKKRVVGGCWFIQLTRAKDTSRWHPHLHCLIDSEFLPQGYLSQHWSAVSAGSTITDIRVVSRISHAANYVSRYVSEPVDVSKLDTPQVAETIRAFHARRLWHPFGTWTKALAAKEPPPHTDHWQPIGQVDAIIHLAVGGDTTARGICEALHIDWRRLYDDF